MRQSFGSLHYIRVLLLGLAGGSAGQTLAAPPDAGSILQEIKPRPAATPGGSEALPTTPTRSALKLDATVMIAVKALRITGAKAFRDDKLQPLVADSLGHELTLTELNEIAQRITRYYRAAGFLLARAYLPAQEIKDGVVEIAVLEGRLGKLSVENRSTLADARVAGYLAELREGDALTDNALERNLLLLSDLPGVEVQSTLKPGASVGATDLDVRVANKSAIGGSLELDNYGNRYIGDWRAGASLAIGNLTGLSDSLVVRALAATGMDYGRIAWQLPVGLGGTQVGAAWSEMRYRLGKDFVNLESHGRASIGTLYALHPVIRGRLTNLEAQLAYDRKHLDDDIDSTSTYSRKELDVFTFGLSGDHVDGIGGGGLNRGSLALVTGKLKLDETNLALDQTGHRTAGHYAKLALNASRLQRLTDDFSLSASLRAQAAGKNLDSSEKMALGGAQAVRAYPQGEASSDDAWLAKLELRYALNSDWQATLFYDGAQGKSNHSPIAADTNNVRRLAGYGVGLACSTQTLSLQLSIAWRDGKQPTSDVDRAPRAWLLAVKRF